MHGPILGVQGRNEHRLLQWTVVEAARNADRGQAPFAAVVVLDGVIIATGTNTTRQTGDPTAHAEVVAIRNAGDHSGVAPLRGAVVFSNAEPCPLCRSAAILVGVSQMVYATPALAVEQVRGPDTPEMVRAKHALQTALPDLVRLGTHRIPQEVLIRPFRSRPNPDQGGRHLHPHQVVPVAPD